MDESLRLTHQIRSMQIDSSAFRVAPSLLLPVVAVEMMVNIALLFFAPVFWRVVWRSGVLGRFYIFYAQYTGVPDNEIAKVFMFAQSMRSTGTIFAVTLLSCFALERFVATYFWSWYEKGSRPTTFVFIATQTFNIVTFHINNELRDKISLDACYAQIMSVGIVGFMGFIFIYRVNLTKYQHMQLGAKIDSYSVARTFQVKENVEVLKYMSWLARGWILFTILSFFTFGFFAFGPTEFQITRAFSYSVFDLFVALYFASFYYLSITGNSHILKKFKKLRAIRRLLKRSNLVA